MTAALTVLPALLGVMGHRINALRLRRNVGREPQSQGRWYRLAYGVIRRPVVYAAVIVVRGECQFTQAGQRTTRARPGWIFSTY
jgi:uncharacterized membrane protein YdfJ with MMPL/SSD domain